LGATTTCNTDDRNSFCRFGSPLLRSFPSYGNSEALDTTLDTSVKQFEKRNVIPLALAPACDVGST